MIDHFLKGAPTHIRGKFPQCMAIRVVFGGLLIQLYLLTGAVFCQSAGQTGFGIEWAKLQGERVAQVRFREMPAREWHTQLQLEPPMDIQSLQVDGDLLEIRTRTPFRLDTHYYLVFPNGTRRFLIPDGILDGLYSEKPLGFQREGGKSVFRVFAPRARWVRLVRYDDPQSEPDGEFTMQRDADGVWEFATDRSWSGKFYGYRLHGPHGNGEMFDSTIVVADPYSRVVATANHYRHPGRTLIVPAPRSGEMPPPIAPINPRDLIIYEMHIRDMTAHPSAGVAPELRGTYLGLAAENQTGGLAHLKKLGINAVELLPTQDFGNIELPYRDSTITGYPINTWNPYERNHWGYMTSYFFAPETYYATGGTMIPGRFNGTDARAIAEFKAMVTALHQNGIAVLMDVVYNHVAQYDQNCFKYIDKYYYFRTTPDGEFLSASGCGNDFKTERRMSRRLIVESVTYWMSEYQIDGFRFDLAALLDWETIDAIRAAAQKINSNVLLIAEPWGGGGYAPARFSDHGWAAWNDQFRNGFKGWNPTEDVGFIFGKIKRGTRPEDLQNYVMGTLREFGGLFTRTTHSVNYLESHDDHTLGDFIRLALGDVTADTRISNLTAHTKLTPRQMRISKLAALALFTSQGPLMLHEGQAYARSKVIAPTSAPDPNVGKIDHNSYEKDNETNWLNYEHVKLNAELFDYYRNLISLRKTYSAFRHAEAQHFHFLGHGDSLLVAYELRYPGQSFLVALNGDLHRSRQLPLPAGEWLLLADGDGVYMNQPKMPPHPALTLPPSSGVILKRMR